MSLNGTVWAPIGPSPIDQGAISANGQVTAIAVNPNNSNIIFIGTTWGGVWRTRDGGTTWTPLFDRAPSLGIGGPGAIAIDPVNTDIVYVGTSSRNGSQFSGDATQPPAGLFKSTDGGASWIRLGSAYPSSAPSNASLFFKHVINVVLVDPANSQTIYLASNGGLFVSTDGGLNWTQGTVPAGDVRSLVLDQTSPTAARILYAGVSGVGVVQSTDGGQNWMTILDATTPAVSGEPLGRRIQRIQQGGRRVGAADFAGQPRGHPGRSTPRWSEPASPFGAADSIGLFQSTNQGGTWTTRATSAVLASDRHELRRLLLPHGRRSRVPRRRGGRHDLHRHAGPGEVHRRGLDLRGD